MMQRSVCRIASALCMVLGAGTAASAQGRAEYLLRVTKPTSMDRVLRDHRLTVVRTIDWLQLTIVRGPEGVRPDALVAEVRADNNVRTFERDHVASTGESAAVHSNLKQTTETLEQALAVDRTLVPFANGWVWAGYLSQPGVALMRADAVDRRGRGIVVAVIDTGIDLEHPLLRNRLVDVGYDFTQNRVGASEGELDQSTAAILEADGCATAEQSTAAILEQECVPGVVNQSTAAILESDTLSALAEAPPLPAAYGHGTMVSGLIYRVAPRAQILPIKAFTAEGAGRSSDIAQAIYYATINGAHVINMSFTFAERSDEVMYATAYAAMRGVILIGAAGNRGLETRTWPAEHKWVVGVGSTNLQDVRSAFSNHGYDTFKVGAPGENLITTYPGGRYAAVSGTSFSAALVSGAAAVMYQVAPLLDWSATSNVNVQAPFAPIMGVARDASNRYPTRLILPPAVALAPVLQQEDVKPINHLK